MKQKKYKITKDLIIAALAYRCPFRTDNNPIYASCNEGENETNCNPRLCSLCTDIFNDMEKIAEQGIENYI